MKKLASLMLVFSIIAGSSLSVFADNQQVEMEEKALEFAKNIGPQVGILTSEDGEQTQVLGELVSARVVDQDKIACTYSYDVSLPRGSGSNTEEGEDSSISITAYNTIEWQTSTIQGYTHCVLTRVSGSWSFIDQQVIVDNCAIEYSCDGIGEDGAVRQSGSKPSVSNNYSYATGFSEYVQVPSLGLRIGQKQTFSLQRGSSTWTFTLNNMPFTA